MAIRITKITQEESWQQEIELIIDEYELHLEAINRSQKTISWYLDILRNFFFVFLLSRGMMGQISGIGRREVDLYIKQLQQSKRWPNKNRHIEDNDRLSPFAIQGKVRALKAFWSWLFKSEYIGFNPLAGYPLPSVPNKLIQVLEKEHIKGLFKAMDKNTPLGSRDYCILLIFLDTGARVSELVSIKLVDLDLIQGTVKLLGKGRKERVVPFHTLTRKELTRYIRHYRPNLTAMKSEYLFPSNDGGHISINCVQQMIRRLAEKSGLQNIKCHPHIFRHTFATMFIAKGGSPSVLKVIMGHESFQTTQKYVHPQRDDLRRQHMRYSPIADLFED
jgi:site-specific recombinase XerD